jgi:hypothetical protein
MRSISNRETSQLSGIFWCGGTCVKHARTQGRSWLFLRTGVEMPQPFSKSMVKGLLVSVAILHMRASTIGLTEEARIASLQAVASR